MPSESDEVAIFWDYGSYLGFPFHDHIGMVNVETPENCCVPAQYTGYEVVKKIRNIAHNFGSIKLFQAYLELSDPTAFARTLALRSELQASGVSLKDCPHNGRKNVADKMMLVDILAYAIDKPPPSTIILISGDRDFAYAVSILRLRRYKVAIISLPMVHLSLKVQASFFLDWTNDVLGAEVVEDSWSPYSRDKLLQKHQKSNLTSRFSSGVPSEPQVRNTRASLRRATLVNINENVDIMNDINGNSTPLSESVDLREISEARSPTRPPSSAPEYGCCLPTDWNASRMRPVASDISSINGFSSTPTVVTEPLLREETTDRSVNETMTSLAEQHSPWNAPSPSFSAIPGQVLTLPAVTPNKLALGTTSPQNRTSSSAPSQLPVLLSNADSTLLSSTMKVEPVKHSLRQPKVVPPKFSLLVQRLEFHRSKGLSRPSRSDIALELASKDHMVYKRAGAERFGQYVALAEKEGIVELGGKEAGAWIALQPGWYNAKIG
ncbi:hypothetical protein H0H93_005377 [Arthromyces matolae]|nr:hypothetical protein H0H93_005377 [Arthromyces matolae]